MTSAAIRPDIASLFFSAAAITITQRETKADTAFPSCSVDTITIRKGDYISTCVYGSYDCPEGWMLRRFRDY